MKYIFYTKQGHIPHLIQPEINGQRLLALEQFITHPIPASDSIVHPTDLNRLFKNHIKSTQKGLGLQNNGNNYVCTPQMLKEAMAKLQATKLILSDPQQEIFEFKYNTKTLNQEAKHHSRFFKFVEQCIGTYKLTVCVCGTSPESIAKSCHDFKRLDDRIDGYGIVLPTSLNVENKTEYLSLLDAFISNTPPDKPRTVLGVSNFQIMLECYKRGVKVIDNSWVERAVEQGLAVTLKKTEKGYQHVVYDFSKDKKDKWEHDFGSIDEQCGCWTCCRHTRSYINHLFCVNDMLSYVMLMYHNMYQMHEFMKLINQESLVIVE